LILRAEEKDNLAAIGTAIYQYHFDFIEEVIVTEIEICLKLNQKFHPAKIGLLHQIEINQKQDRQTIKLPVYFQEHQDWQALEQFSGLSKPKIIAKILEQEYDVAMFGFLPGFTYFNGLDKALHIPRKSVPAKYIAANSFAIGGKYLGLYSIESPGGWYVIGQTPIPILQLPELPPVSLNLGDKIILVSITSEVYQNLSEQSLSLKAYNA